VTVATKQFHVLSYLRLSVAAFTIAVNVCLCVCICHSLSVCRHELLEEALKAEMLSLSVSVCVCVSVSVSVTLCLCVDMSCWKKQWKPRRRLLCGTVQQLLHGLRSA